MLWRVIRIRRLPAPVQPLPSDSQGVLAQGDFLEQANALECNNYENARYLEPTFRLERAKAPGSAIYCIASAR